MGAMGEEMSGYTNQGVGYQDTDTSLQAAIDMSAKTGTIKEQVLQCLHGSVTGLTTEEIADRLGKPYGSVQPRLSELQNDKRVRDSGWRKMGRWEKMIIVWELV